MARKTKAQMAAEQAAYTAALKAAEVEQYPTLLLDTLERATKLGYELTAVDRQFVVRDWNSNAVWSLTPLYTKESQENLDTLVWDVEEEELRRLAAEAKAQAKAAALAKLTKEERELLGLNTR